MRLPVNISNVISAASAYRKTDYDTKQPIVNSDGENLWVAPAMVNDGKRVEQLDIQTYSKTCPTEGIAPMTPLKIEGAYVSMGTYHGKTYAKVWATRITKA